MRTSWAIQGAARAVDWLCPAQYRQFRCVFILHGVDHTPTNRWKACLFAFCSCPRDTTYTKIEKYKSDHNLPEQTKAGFPFVYTCMRFKYDTKNSDRHPQNWAGQCSNSIGARDFLIPFLMCSSKEQPFFGHISWRLTNWAVQLISIVSSCLQDCLHQISPWSGTMIVEALIRVTC